MSQPQDGPAARGLVLVADDEPQLLRLLRRVLEGGGYRVLTARDGDDAARACAAGGPAVQVLVLDAGITPHGSGPVLAALRTRGVRPGIVLTSGDALDPALREQLELRAGIFLRKPFSPTALLRSVAELAARGAGRPAGAAPLPRAGSAS